MKENTPDVNTLLKNPRAILISQDNVFNKTSLDELWIQLFSIFRKNEFYFQDFLNNQKVIELRTKKGIHKILPGLTGYAQINGRDNLTIEEKVKFDEYYLYNMGIF